MSDDREFRIGPFSTGDLIALGSVIFMSGALWWRVAALESSQARFLAEDDRLLMRIQAVEQVIPSEYVRRQDYREDMREVKEYLRRIDSKLDSKVDKP